MKKSPQVYTLYPKEKIILKNTAFSFDSLFKNAWGNLCSSKNDLLIWMAEWQGEEVKEVMSFHFVVHLPNDNNSQGWIMPKPGIWDSILISHVASRE